MLGAANALDLRPDDEFKPQIEQEIRKREVFFLFWSRNARATKWVRWASKQCSSNLVKRLSPLCLSKIWQLSSPAGLENQYQRDRFMTA